MRSLTKGAHRRYGGDSGDHCSNSSDSSVESKSSRHTVAYRSTNFSIQNQSSRLNRRNHDNKLLTSMETATTSNILQFKSNHTIDNDVDALQTRDWDVMSSTNIDSRTITRMPVDDDVRSVRTLPSTFNSNYKFKNMFSLGSKVYDNSQNSKRTNCLSKTRNEHTLRRNASMWSLNSFGRSIPIFSSEEKDTGNETSDDQLACSNKSSCYKFYDKNKHTNVNNDRNHNNDNINLANPKNFFRTSNSYANDNRSVRSEPSIFKNDRTLSKSKAPSKKSLDVVPRVLVNATSQNRSVNNFPSTSQIDNSSMYNSSRLGKTFNNLIRVPPIEETDENDDVPNECSTTIKDNSLIENQLKLGETNNINAKEKQIYIFGRHEQACMEQNERSLNVSKKGDNGNVSVQYMPSIFSYNSNMCSKPVANTRNVFGVKMRTSSNTSLQNRKLADLTSRFNNEVTSGVPLKVMNNPISKSFITGEQESGFRKDELLASSSAAAIKNKNRCGNIINDRDVDENIIFSKSDGLRVNPNDQQRQQNITSGLHVSSSKTKTTSDFIFAKPKTPRPQITSKSRNYSIPQENPFNKEARITKLSNNVSELMQQSDEEENIFNKCKRRANEHNHVEDGGSEQNLQDSTTISESSKSKGEAMNNSVFIKPKTPRPQIKAKPKGDVKSNKNQSYKMSRSSDLSVNTSELTHQSADISIRPSFIKRKLFTQTLEITENSQNDSPESLPHSPVCNIYSMKPNSHKAYRSLLPKSLLRVDVDDHDLQRNQSNMSQLVQKIVPQKRISALTQNVQDSNKLQDEENSDDDRWDVTSIMSMHNKDDISDTYSDTGSDHVNLNSNNDFEYNQEAKFHTNSRMELKKLATQQLNNLKKTDKPKNGVQNSVPDKLQVNTKCNIINKKTENLSSSILKTNARSQKFKTVKNQMNEEVKTSDKIKETLKTRRKRSLSEVNDSDALKSQSKRAKRSYSTSIDNNKVAPREGKHKNNRHSAKKSIGIVSRKSSKELNTQKSKITRSNIKLNNKGNCKKNNANYQEIRLTRNSLNRSLRDSLTLMASESIHSRLNKEHNTQRASNTESNRKLNNKDDCKKNIETYQDIRVTRNSLNRSLHNSLSIASSERIRSRTQKAKNLDTPNKQAKAVPSKRQINKVDSKKPTIVSETRSRKEVNPEKVPILNSDYKSQKLDDDCMKNKEILKEVRVTCVPVNISSQDSLDIITSDSIHSRRMSRKEVVHQENISSRDFLDITSDSIPSRRMSRKEVVHQESKKKMDRWRSNEDITKSRRRQSPLHAKEGHSKVNNVIQKHDKKELRNNNKREGDTSKDQNPISAENRSKDIYSKSVQGLGIAKSRFDIVPRHCSRGRLGCDGDSKSIISTSTIMTRSKNKLFINAF
ncbi:hypothetical protein EVAR_78061_1 [Eumeta japonica]|uniref:Uncharacterized protein n=1 Tax=Eumeta variegata TaxID=151549 RepID=A0A4C1T0B8_EUMVA|nr:hypothetical protein EVAR_78061_1 [Eumeta japonica]